MDLYEVRGLLNSGKTIYDIPMRVTFYARVSTDKYEQANSLKNQVDYFGDMIKSNNKWQYAEGYIDEGISGTSVNKRDSFLKMIRDARQHKFDFIITKEISRFSRNTLDSIKFTQELLSYGVGVLFQTDNINTLYPDAELRLTIMSSIAQEEVRKLSERVKFGFKRSIESGRVLGNNSIWGYRKEDGKLVIDEEQAEIVKIIFELYASKRLGIRAVAKELAEMGYKNGNGNIFSFTTIKNIISNPKYKGYYCGNKTKVVDYRLKNRIHLDEEEWVLYKDDVNVPAIVDEEIWEQANRILHGRGEKAKEHAAAYQSRYTYSGKIFCAEHGTSFHRAIYRYKSGEKEVWQCKMYRQMGKTACMSPTLYTTELDIVIKDAFEEFIMKRTDVIHRIMQRYDTALTDTDISKEIERKQKEIDKIVVKKDKILELSIDGRLSNDEFAARNNKLNDEIDAIKVSIRELKSEKEKVIRTKESIKALHEIISKKANLTDEVGNSELINAALDKIVVYKTDDKDKVKLKIFFKFDQDYDVEYNRKDMEKGLHHFVTSNTYDGGEHYNRGFTDSRLRKTKRGAYTLSAQRV